MSEEAGSSDLQLTAYVVSAETLPLRVADRHRDWMETSPDRYAYRCLPLVIANQAGWELLSPCAFTASWNGGTRKEDVELVYEGKRSHLIHSHFGSGILTFSPGYLFRTSPGHNLWCKGPINEPKDGIAPLEGIIETDWAPYAFTMNWKFTRPCSVHFAAAEPIALLVPQRRGELARFKTQIRPITDDAALQRQYRLWNQSRAQFIADLNDPESEARQQRWQRAYMLGRDSDQNEFAEHETKLQLCPFIAADTSALKR